MSVSAEKNTLFRWALSGALVALLAALATNREFYDSSMISPFLSLALASSVIILLVLRRSWSDFLLVVAGGALLAALDLHIRLFPYRFMGWFSFLGLSGFAVLGLHAIWARNHERKVMVCAFLPAALFVGSEYMASTLLDITERLHPKVFDLYLYSFDCSLRVQISFALGKVVAAWHWLSFTCLLFYLALPLPLALVFAARLRQGIGRALPVMLAFLITGPLGVLFYNMLPACGPIHLFGPAFPWHPPAIAEVMRMKLQTVRIAHDARNAIPSLHMAWVLLVWWSSRTLRLWIRAVAFAFLAFTAVATMGIGEHYFVDVVVAYPFALMVMALCSYMLPLDNEKRRTAFLWGTFATLLWFALLTFAIPVFWITPLLPWITVIATVGVTVVLEGRLQAALEAEIPQSPAAQKPVVNLTPANADLTRARALGAHSDPQALGYKAEGQQCPDHQNSRDDIQRSRPVR